MKLALIIPVVVIVPISLTWPDAAPPAVAIAPHAKQQKTGVHLAPGEWELAANEETVELEIAEAHQRIALLNAQILALRSQLAAMEVLIVVTDMRNQRSAAQIAALGAQLNAELERSASHRVSHPISMLAGVRAEFFGRMREALFGVHEVRISGDHFLLPADALFDPDSAELGPTGRAELSRLAEVIREFSLKVPQDLDWMLRIDGHTDMIPVSDDGPFRDNWELSQARALSALRHLVKVEAIPGHRVAAAGFGEFQPIYPGDDRAEMARNRRIEISLVHR